METLFPVGPEWPEGFRYEPDFLSREEEALLLQVITSVELHSFLFQGYEAKRRVASFGFDWSFTHRRLSRGRPIPEAFRPVVERVALHLSLDPREIAEVLVTEYPVGSVINWHRDAPPFELIAGISLHADCVFRLRPHEKSRQGRHSLVSLPVRRRSLYVMQGPARWDWQHSTAPVKEVRYSLTLRTLKDTSLLSPQAFPLTK